MVVTDPTINTENPINEPVQNGTSDAETAADASTGKGGARTLWINPDVLEAIKREADGDKPKNRNVNAPVHPHLYVALLEKMATINNGEWVETEDNKKRLKDGALGESVRLALASWTGYTGDTVITTIKVKNSVQQQINALQGTAVTMFKRAREMAISFGAQPEQAKPMQFATIKEMAASFAPDVEITDEMLESMWNASAA